MTEYIKKAFQKNFIKNVIILVTGTAAAQIVAIALSPIITRLYGPEAFGMMGSFLAIVNILAPIAALSYPIAIVLPKKDQEAIRLIQLSILITSIIAIVSLIIIIIFNNQITSLFNINEINKYLFLIPLVIVFAGLMQVANQWLIRTKQFRINAKVTFYHSIILYGSKVVIGLIHPVASVLIVLSAFGHGIRAFLLHLFARKSRKSEKVQFNIKKLINLAKKYYDFPMFRSPEVFLNAISQGLPVLMLTTLFGPASAGFYSIGRTVLSMPSTLIGKAVGDVFYPRIAEAYNNREDTTALIRKATFSLALVGLFPFGSVILFGPSLFSFVFGEEWLMAGEYARWIALWSYFGFMNRPSVMSLPVFKAQKFHLIYTIIMLATRLGVLAIGYYYFSSDIISIAFFGISGAILNFGLITITMKISQKRMEKQ